jgi:cytoskeletal protein CcmA (bactofilin family)
MPYAAERQRQQLGRRKMDSNVLNVEERSSSRVDDVTSGIDTQRFFQSWLEDLGVLAHVAGTTCEHQSRRGEIVFDGTLSIDGYVFANVRSTKGTMIVAGSGEVDGEIVVETAIVQGLVRGDIKAANVEMESTGRVIGQIKCSTLSVHAGAVFEGQIASLSDRQQPQSELPRFKSSKKGKEHRDEISVLAVA